MEKTRLIENAGTNPKIKKNIESFKYENKNFIRKFLSLHKEEVKILSVLLLWSLNTKVKKGKYAEEFLIYFQSNYRLSEIFKCVSF